MSQIYYSFLVFFLVHTVRMWREWDCGLKGSRGLPPTPLPKLLSGRELNPRDPFWLFRLSEGDQCCQRKLLCFGKNMDGIYQIHSFLGIDLLLDVRILGWQNVATLGQRVWHFVFWQPWGVMVGCVYKELLPSFLCCRSDTKSATFHTQKNPNIFVVPHMH